jgi:hypothetical protein
MLIPTEVGTAEKKTRKRHHQLKEGPHYQTCGSKTFLSPLLSFLLWRMTRFFLLPCLFIPVVVSVGAGMRV